MAKKEKNKKQIPLVILIIIFCSLLYAMYVSLSTWVLVIFGDSVVGTVDSYNSRSDEIRSEQNKSRTISKGYYFFVGGKEYNGYVMYNSDESWADLCADCVCRQEDNESYQILSPCGICQERLFFGEMK